MKISEDTQSVINYIDEYTGGNLRKKNDLSAILELCANNNNAEILNRLIFTGKSLWNIYSKMRKVGTNTDGIELLQKEIERCCGVITEYLIQIVQDADADLQKRFDEVYFPRTRGSVRNLIDLAYDLAKFKDLQTANRNRAK